MPDILRKTAFALLMLMSSLLFAVETAVPSLTAPVMDTAQMMSSTERETLNAHLLQYSRDKGSQIVVLTVPSIGSETPFEYSARVMEAWQLGRKDVNDGVLLLLVRDERKTHLAVGRGLEGAIPDVYAKRILQDVLAPKLREGKTDEGIAAAVVQIEKLIAGEKLPETRQTENTDTGGDSFLVLLFVPLIAGSLLVRLFGLFAGSGITGGLTFLAALLFGWSFGIALVVGFIGAMLALFFFSLGAFVSGGGNGGFGGGSPGGWNSSGGGFSGGGGSFGGGGASGSW
ncbi:hypothetical protein BG910_09615 [Neisseria chenwenguii]|uniref:TPM domain-containing protein n=2 Tax=Neisseria chenwenguii TaxID=1853278 RepID=A0A220S543_9NEIS|nr:hypothetical protein BG910_09615 [Neisseria chenwenguii]